MDDLQLHDIKGLVEIPDNSIYYFYSLITVILVLIALGAYAAYRYFKRDRAINMQKLYKKQLSELDIAESKSSAYSLSYLGQLIEKTSEQEALFENLFQALEAFKYKKDVPEFDEELKTKIEQFRQSLYV